MLFAYLGLNDSLIRLSYQILSTTYIFHFWDYGIYLIGSRYLSYRSWCILKTWLEVDSNRQFIDRNLMNNETIFFNFPGILMIRIDIYQIPNFQAWALMNNLEIWSNLLPVRRTNISDWLEHSVNSLVLKSEIWFIF